MKTCIIIPALNEENKIGEVIDKLLKLISEKDIILVIDDGSKDNTKELAISKGCEVLSNVKNMGKGFSIRRGFEYALKTGSQIMVTLDADGQHDPNEIEKLTLPIMNNECDFTIGSRFLNTKNLSKMSITHYYGNIFFTKIVNFLTGLNFTDTQCDFRAYSRESILKLYLSGNYTHVQESIIDLSFKGLIPKEIKLDNVESVREFGKSRVVSNPFSYGFRALKLILKTYRDNNPLKFFGTLGHIVLLVSLFTALILVGTDTTERPDWLLWLNSDYTIVGIFSSLFVYTVAIISDINNRQRNIQDELLYLLRTINYKK